MHAHILTNAHPQAQLNSCGCLLQMFLFPRMAEGKSIRVHYDKQEWNPRQHDIFRAWRKGNTGYGTLAHRLCSVVSLLKQGHTTYMLVCFVTCMRICVCVCVCVLAVIRLSTQPCGSCGPRDGSKPTCGWPLRRSCANSQTVTGDSARCACVYVCECECVCVCVCVCNSTASSNNGRWYLCPCMYSHTHALSLSPVPAVSTLRNCVRVRACAWCMVCGVWLAEMVHAHAR